MLRYAAFRVLQMIPVMAVLSFIVFLALYLIPGDPTGMLLGGEATPAAIDALRQKWGLNDPLPVRYAHWISNIAHGDLGDSVLNGRSVLQLARSAFPVTLELATLGLVIALLIAVPAAVYCSTRRGSVADSGVRLVAFLGMSAPTFWLGLIAISVFAVHLRWLPSNGFIPFARDPIGNVRTMVLPACTLGFFLSTQLMRYLRAGIIRTMYEPHVRTARSKGLFDSTIMFRHIVWNALIPFLTVLGIQVGELLGGTVVIEEVFGLPGMGRLALQALLGRDYQVVAGMVMLLAALFLSLNLIVDLTYGLLDPRVRHRRPAPFEPDSEAS